MTNMNRFYFQINCHITKIMKTIRRMYYGEERTLWIKNSVPLH